MEHPTIEEIWKWTMTPNAIAACFARDVFDMRENLEGGADFYWLGRVPCRTVCLIGMVVGLQVFENRILYSIDDGTAVIDCAYRPQRAPKTPSKKDRQKYVVGEATGEMPKPVARIGLPIKVVGKVQRAYGTRQIQADDIERCRSMNDEPLHWRRVRELHKTNYDLKEPFVIPPGSAAAAPTLTVEPTTPSTKASSPVASVANSPVKPAPLKPFPLKLRHPSRLHSRDLTDNTFRIYVKHYMLNAPSVAMVSMDGVEAVGGTTTPIKRRVTPNHILTPRSGISETGIERRVTAAAAAATALGASYCGGFTLSYLRRVPELAEMARRVVIAEAKRRVRERRKKKHSEGRSGGSAARPPSTAATQDISVERVGTKMKRLFKWAIIQLLHEGSIVLWDGPMRGCDAHGPETSGLWRTSTTTSVSLGTEGGISGTSGGACHARGDIPEEEEEEEELSEPEEEEEGYMAVTAAFLGDCIEEVIRGSGRAGGVTKEGIVAGLRRDDRWKFIGEWQVQEALEYVQQESRAWRVGERWELTV